MMDERPAPTSLVGPVVFLLRRGQMERGVSCSSLLVRGIILPQAVVEVVFSPRQRLKEQSREESEENNEKDNSTN